MYQYNLEVGSVIIGLQVKKKALHEWLARYFKQQSSCRDPHIVLALHIDIDRPYEMVPNSVFQSKSIHGKRFKCSGGVLKGRFDPGRQFVKLLMHPVMIQTEASRVFEQILYQAYVDVLKTGYAKKPLLHSSGVIRNGLGYVFLGPSESGKSTVAQLSSDFQVLNDEICILDISGASPRLHSTPFNGLFLEKSRGSAPLAGIFILHKDSSHRVEPVSGADIIKTISKEIIPPVGIGELMEPNVYFKQLDIASALCSSIPVFNLYFRKDAAFWPIIEREAASYLNV